MNKTAKRISALVIAAIMYMSLFCACGKKDSDSEMLSGKHYAKISVKDYGEILLELDADSAPITVTNFVDLVKQGFYDGLTFHRVISGFMIQGGDPNGDGRGGSGKTIKGEFSANGVANDIKHTRGTISMARNGVSMDSASSQFFICQSDYNAGNGQYAAFGHVLSGMGVVDAICADYSSKGDSNGILPDTDRPVIEYIRVTDEQGNNLEQ